METRLAVLCDAGHSPTETIGLYANSTMLVDDLYESLIHAHDRGVRYMITFCDGDSYWLTDIDLCFSVGHDGQREYEPLRVDFADCIGDSVQYRNALRDDGDRMAAIWRTSDDSREPVGCDYFIADVCTVFDDDGQFALYSAATDN